MKVLSLANFILVNIGLCLRVSIYLGFDPMKMAENPSKVAENLLGFVKNGFNSIPFPWK